MTVLSVAYPLAHVGPDAVGGAEQVLATLDTSLVKAGHHSLVVASADSQVEGELIPLPEVRGAFDSETLLAMHRHCLQAIRAALTRHKVDLVHMHGLDFHAYLPPAGVPVLTTLHLPIAWYPPAIFACERPATFLHCVSDAQNRDCPPSPNLLPPIYNGVAIASAAGACNKRYALAIGRICPEKGFHLALDAATLAGVPLLLAGKTFPYEAHESYFRQEVKPRLNGLHAYVGPVGGEAKHKLYAEARCLIVASTVAETSSLVALEALACGTPVVAFRAGALPEIIADGRNGFLVDSIEEMGRAITRSVEIDPEDCRKTVRDRFSIETMTARYMETFRSLCKASSLFRFV